MLSSGDRQPHWTELDGLVRRARGHPERLGPDGVLRLGALYRAAVADLARGAESVSHRSVRPRGSRTSSRGRVGPCTPCTADAARHAQYLRAGYWQAVRERAHGRAAGLGVAARLGRIGTVWAHPRSGWRPRASCPGSLAGGGGGPHRAIGLGAGQAAELSVSIFTNNIGVTFMAFASGIAFGILPAFLLLYNGLLLGVVVGIASSTGHGTDVIELIVPHGMLELSCIAVSAAAGMRMGWTLVEPGTRSRSEALAAEAPRAVLLVLATAPWLIVAGLIEGFVTPHHLALLPALAIGVAAAGPYWLAVARLGRERAPRSAARAGGLEAV